MSLVSIILVALLPYAASIAMMFTCQSYDSVDGNSDDSTPYPVWLLFISPFSYGRGAALAFSCADANVDNTLGSCSGGELWKTILYMWIGSIVLGIVSIYLHVVIPSGSEVSEHPLLCLKSKYDAAFDDANNNSNDANRDGAQQNDENEGTLEQSLLEEGGAIDSEDSDVRAEKERVAQIVSEDILDSDTLLLCHNVKKRYSRLSPFVVDGISLIVEKNECFGLLGP